MRDNNDDTEFEEEFKTDPVNGLPQRAVTKVPKLQFPDSPQFKGSANNRGSTIDHHSTDTIDIFHMKSIKENNAIVGSMQKSILKKRNNMQPLIREDHRMEDAFRSEGSGGEDSREGQKIRLKESGKKESEVL
jgi:hypothetical protein